MDRCSSPFQRAERPGGSTVARLATRLLAPLAAGLALLACEAAPPAEAGNAVEAAEGGGEPGLSAALAADIAALEAASEETARDEPAGDRVLYQYIDDKGSVRFVEHLADVPQAWRDRAGQVAMEPIQVAAPPSAPSASPSTRSPSSSEPLSAERRKRLAEEAYQEQVARAQRWRSEPTQLVLYSAKWCGWCKRAEAHLDREGVRYTRRDVDIPAVERELIALIGQKSVPVLDVDGKVYRGYVESVYDQVVDRVQGS